MTYQMAYMLGNGHIPNHLNFNPYLDTPIYRYRMATYGNFNLNRDLNTPRSQ